MRLAPLYRATFTPQESWHAELRGEHGVEEQGFLIVEGRCEGRISARLRAANAPRRRTDGTQTPDFRGVLETDDGAVILFSWHGYGRTQEGGRPGLRGPNAMVGLRGPNAMVGLLGSLTHLSDDDRYAWLNGTMCALAGELLPSEGGGFSVVVEVSELVWEPLG